MFTLQQIKSTTRRMAIANGTCVSFCTFWPPWVRPWDNRGKCYMNGKKIQCCRIYPSIFNRLRAIARYWSGIATFSYPLQFNAPVGVFPLGKSFRKLESARQWRQFDDRLSHFDTIPACDGRTHRRSSLSITCTVILAHVKKCNFHQSMNQSPLHASCDINI